MASLNAGKNELWPERVTHKHTGRQQAEGRRNDQPSQPPLRPLPLVAYVQPANSLFRRRYKLTLALFTLGSIFEPSSERFCFSAANYTIFHLGEAPNSQQWPARSVQNDYLLNHSGKKSLIINHTNWLKSIQKQEEIRRKKFRYWEHFQLNTV